MTKTTAQATETEFYPQAAKDDHGLEIKELREVLFGWGEALHHLETTLSHFKKQEDSGVRDLNIKRLQKVYDSLSAVSERIGKNIDDLMNAEEDEDDE